MDRIEEIKKLRDNNWSWNAIGRIFGLSRSRVHQLGSGYASLKAKKYQKKILKRDNYSCQWKLKCNGDNDDLLIHHLDLNDKNNNSKNLITLCRACHQFLHIKLAKLSNGFQKWTKTIKVKCKNCGIEKDILKSARQIKRFFCSKKCREEYNLKIRKSKCETCGKDFYCHYTIISHHKKPRFCSKKCQGKWLGNNYGFKRNKKNISYSILNN